MKTKEQVREEYSRLDKTIGWTVSEIYRLAGAFGALISFLRRRLPEKDYKWAEKWIYEICNLCDYEWRQKYDDHTEAQRIYEDENWRLVYYGGSINNIKEIFEPFGRAINTLGEIKCSIMPKYKSIQSIDDEIEENLSFLRGASND